MRKYLRPHVLFIIIAIKIGWESAMTRKETPTSPPSMGGDEGEGER
jgi:hypothetical protein